MVKVGGNEKDTKYVKKTLNLTKSGKICKSRGKEKLIKLGKGEIANLWSRTKKRSSEVLAAGNRKIVLEKVKIFHAVRKMFPK